MQLYADVVSFTPTDPRKSLFTYALPKKLSKSILIGQLVSIPWGKRTTQGVIIEIKRETQVKNPKPIKEVLLPIPILLPNYIKILKWMSWYYYAPMLDCLKAMLPEIRISYLANRIPKRKINIRKRQQAAGDKQILILVPTINQIRPVFKKFNKSKGILIYHKQLSKKELWEAWWKIYYGQAEVIIGTRSAVFTQCQNLREIKIINEDESGFGNIQSPYFDTLKVASILAKFSKAKLKIETATPRPETYYNFPKKITKGKPKVKPEIRIENLGTIRKFSKSGYISPELKRQITEKVQKKKSVLLFLNRIKESGQIYCNECKYSGYIQSPCKTCPNCQGNNFNFYSLNLKNIGKQILKFLPMVGLKLITEGKITTIVRGKPVITLATNAVFSKSFKKFSLIGVISADTILNLPDFNSSFKTFATIIKLSQLTDKFGEVIIQTYNPEHPAIKLAANSDFANFYQQELVLRKKLEFPPFATLAKLSLKMKNRQKAEKEAKKLKTQLEKTSLLVDISEPVKSWQENREFNIIARAKKREELDEILAHVPSKWKVVVDPDSLL